MAYCNKSLAGISIDCSTSKGGIKRVYIANYTGAEVFQLGADGNVSGITTGVTFYEYNFKKNTGSMTSTLNVDAANGINYVTSEVLLQFNKMDTVKRIEISALALNDLVAIVEDSNGVRYALGVEEPVNATAGTGQTGTAKGDGNFYQITLTDENSSFPPIVPSTVDFTIAD